MPSPPRHRCRRRPLLFPTGPGQTPSAPGIPATRPGSSSPEILSRKFRPRTPRGANGLRRRETSLLVADKEKKKKESILDLSKYIDKTIRVKFQGGREASGVLKGFDPLLNLVLDGTIEYMRDPDDQYKLTEDTRQLGLVVCRGTSVVLICPQDGMEAIPNPFIQQQDG
ncbi:U6 snRNA-associated Sm-like protein LSm7 isoform X1 [Numida meleagris]|uniref:U6 snRNA-associated Sm-like protein LSm7 isoform X1 n=1 Tax=Numida meleagris TaxID=8996 RepID=UPI000B3DE4BB|nr:U6 snRNA-associated Sm-like protein LSm7 isoform X1 [Numida meleagris]